MTSVSRPHANLRLALSAPIECPMKRRADVHWLLDNRLFTGDFRWRDPDSTRDTTIFRQAYRTLELARKALNSAGCAMRRWGRDVANSVRI